ncbi:Rhodanese-like domain-containing protein [Gorgonomyces haynaldii]|nr:Rhodanese-like domain-containing protein [Gorgonomyces haynaldii]
MFHLSSPEQEQTLTDLFRLKSPLTSLAQDLDINLSFQAEKTPRKSLFLDLTTCQSPQVQNAFKKPLPKNLEQESPLVKAKFRNQNLKKKTLDLFKEPGVSHWNQRKPKPTRHNTVFSMPQVGSKRAMDEHLTSPTTVAVRTINKEQVQPHKMRRAATANSVISMPAEAPPLLESTLESCDMIRRISIDTLASILYGNHLDPSIEFHLVDARYPYEYNGGHIGPAVNISSCQDLETRFFSKPPTRRTCIVFHCEYSIQRAPQMALHFRKLDRYINAMHYPSLYYPDVYILKGGYRLFYEKYQMLCQPQGYVEMTHPAYAEECLAGQVFQKKQFKRI